MHAIRHPTFPSFHVLSHVPSPDSALRRGRLACPHGSIHSGERCCRRATSCWLPLVACGRHSLSPPILTFYHQMNPQPLASVSPARCALLSRAPRHLAGSPPSLSLAGLHRQLSSPHSSHCCLNQHLLATFPSPWAHVPVRPNNPRPLQAAGGCADGGHRDAAWAVAGSLGLVLLPLPALKGFLAWAD